LANGGVASNVGQSSSAASNLVINNATLKYTGGATSTDRLFTLGDNGASIDGSGTGALVFANTGALAFSGSAGRLLTLTGTNTDDNTMAPVLANNAGISSLTKAGTGEWVIKGVNTYTGPTTILAGTLNVGDGSDASASLGPNTVSIGTDSTLNFSHNAAVTVANAISGTGQLNKLGGNTLSLTGVNNYTGTTGTGTAGGVVFTNNTAPTTAGFTGAGTVTIEPSTTFANAFTANYTFANTISGFTWGKSSNVADLTLASPFTIAGPISFYGGNIHLNANVSSSLTTAPLLFKASGNVTQASNVAVGSNVGDITLWANSDGDTTHYGSILLNPGASISSQNGNITLGGGSSLATGYATHKTTNVGSMSGNMSEYSAGLTLFDAAINAGTGTVTARGESVGSADDYAMGVLLFGNTDTSSITGGTVTIVGLSNNAGNAWGNGSSNSGIAVIKSAITGSGAVSLNGTGSAGTGGNASNNRGIYLNEASISSTGSSVSLTGAGRATNEGIDGVSMVNASATAATALTLSGTTTQAGSSALRMDALSTLTAGGTTHISGNANMVLGNLRSTGALSINTTLGNVNQTAGSTIVAASTTALTVANADVTLDNTGNDMTGLISVSNAANLSLRSTALTMDSVASSGSQTYNSPVVLPSNTGFTGTQVNFNQSVIGSGSLTITGQTVLNGATIQTTGAQVYNSAVTLSKNNLLSTGGTAGVTFASTVNGGHSLTVNSAGAMVFGGEVGVLTALSSLTTDQAGTVEINTAKVKTTGAQTYRDRVLLGADSELQGVNLSFLSAVDGAQQLTIRDSGTTVIEGMVGGATALTSLNTDAEGETHLKGLSIRTSTDLIFNDSVKLFTDVGLQAAGQLMLAKTVDGDNANTRSLSLNGGNTAAINLQGVVGGWVPLKTLTLVNSESSTFTAEVTTGTSIVLQNTGLGISFLGGLNTPSLSVADAPFALTLRGNVVVTNPVTMANTGYLQLGGVESDDLNFVGGLVASTPSTIGLAGTLRTTDQAIVLGRVGSSISLLADTTLNSGAGSLHLAGR
jgi:fibronectin-binding autotransporter adhesin